MKIRVIVPTTADDHIVAEQEKFQEIARSDTEISTVGLESAPDTVENDFDIALSLPCILDEVRKAEQESMQAAIIDCMSDLGVQAARRFSCIPVMGPAEASMHYATLLAHSFSIIGVIPKDRVFYTRLLRRFDLVDRCVSIPVVDVPILEILESDDPGKLVDACFEASLIAIREDGAAAIILGFAGMPDAVSSLQGRLAESGHAIPVIDPTLATLKLAECLVDLGVVHND